MPKQTVAKYFCDRPGHERRAGVQVLLDAGNGVREVILCGDCIGVVTDVYRFGRPAPGELLAEWRGRGRGLSESRLGSLLRPNP